MTASALVPHVGTDSRTDEILGLVRAAFAEKGFDGASMQDLARAAGMSVGNFYRYFNSKAAIVEALIHRDLAEIEASFAAIMGSDDPLAALRATLQWRVGSDCAADGQLWAEITAAALRKPDIGAVCCKMEDEIARYMTTVFARITGISPEEAILRFHAHAELIVMLVKSSSMQSARNFGQRADLSSLVLRTIDRTLDDIVSTAVKG